MAILIVFKWLKIVKIRPFLRQKGPFIPTSILLSVTRDKNLLKNMLEKFEQYFDKILLPETVTIKFDISNENDRKLYCFCKRTSFGNMITCDCSTCSYEWFHYGCVNVTRATKGRRFCSDCSKKQKK